MGEDDMDTDNGPSGEGTSQREGIAIAPYDMTRIERIEPDGTEVPVKELDSHEKFAQSLQTIDFSDFQKFNRPESLLHLPLDKWDPIAIQIRQATTEVVHVVELLKQLKQNQLWDVQRVEVPEVQQDKQAKDLSLMIAQKRKDLEEAQQLLKGGCATFEDSKRELADFLKSLKQLLRFWNIKRTSYIRPEDALPGGGGFVGVIVDFGMPGPSFQRPGVPHTRLEDQLPSTIPSYVQMYKNRKAEIELHVRGQPLEEELTRGNSVGVVMQIVHSTCKTSSCRLRSNLPPYPAEMDMSLKAIHIRLLHAQRSYFHYALFNSLSRDVESMKNSPCLHSTDEEVKIRMLDKDVARISLGPYATEFDANPKGRGFNVWELVAQQMLLTQSRRHSGRIPRKVGTKRTATEASLAGKGGAVPPVARRGTGDWHHTPKVQPPGEEKKLGGRLVSVMNHRSTCDTLRTYLHSLFIADPGKCPYSRVQWLNTCRPDAHAVNLIMKKGPKVQIAVESGVLMVPLMNGPVAHPIPMDIEGFKNHMKTSFA